MQNAQNTEIQQRVINLVELYRTKVGKESQIAKDAKDDYDFWEKESIDEMIENNLSFGGFYGEGPHTEVWIKHLMVNEQLLGHFYAEIAGESAEQFVLKQFLPDVYDKTIFNEEEEKFLKLHFKEMVNYIIQTPCDDSLKWVHRGDNRDSWSIPAEVLDLIDSRVTIAPESVIYYPNSGFGQLANLFQNCKFFCEDENALLDVAFYANGIDARIIGGVRDEWMQSVTNPNYESGEVEYHGSIPTSYDAVITYIEDLLTDGKDVLHFCEAYKRLKSGGQIVLLCPSKLLADTKYSAFRKLLVNDKAIKEIIQLPAVMSNNASSSTYCLLIAEKGYADDATLIDARTASNDIDTKHHKLSFDMAKFDAIMENDGKDPNTGLRKVVRISTEYLSQHLLVPEVYTIERPSETEHPVPLSSLCSLESTLVRDVQFDLPEDTPWITMSDLTPLFTGDMNLSDFRRADCPNDPPFVEGSKDYAFDKDGKFVDSIWVQMNTKKGQHVLEYRQCTFHDGNTDAVLYERSNKHGVQVAVVRATGKPYAVSKGILVFCPKNGIDVSSLAALLRLPVVSRQLAAYEKYGIEAHLGDILAPTDKRVIGDELSRMKKEESVTNELGDRVQSLKTEYINEVRMRKHDMRPHMKQLNSAKNLMQHYVENIATTENVQNHLRQQLSRFQDALGHLSDIIAHLSDEEEFGEPERFPIAEHLQTLISEYSRMGYTVNFKYNEDDAKDYLKLKIDEFINDIRYPEKAKKYELKEGEFSFPLLWSYAYISPLDFDRMIQNIIENARKHGFTDSTRTDYEIWINLSVDTKREMYQIDFMNNGTPLPEGMTKDRFGIRGEKAGITGGTGSGGYIIKSIVNHYGGDYDVFSKDGITTVRIYLPIAKI